MTLTRTRQWTTLLFALAIALTFVLAASPARAEPRPGTCTSTNSLCDVGSISCPSPRTAVVEVSANGWTNVFIGGVKKDSYQGDFSTRTYFTGKFSVTYEVWADSMVNKFKTTAYCTM